MELTIILITSGIVVLIGLIKMIQAFRKSEERGYIDHMYLAYFMLGFPIFALIALSKYSGQNPGTLPFTVLAATAICAVLIAKHVKKSNVAKKEEMAENAPREHVPQKKKKKRHKK